MTIEPGTLQFDATGAPYSARYGDVYASRDGAYGQARHVFLGGNGLPERWAGREQFVIVETGFGLGVNFLAAWQAWRDDPRRPRRLHFVSIEQHPLSGPDLLRAAPPALMPLAAQLAQCWPLPLAGLHRRCFEGSDLVLTLGFGDARHLVPELIVGADAFFLDGFAPNRNPQLWEAPLLKALGRLARPGATLATWTAARAVRDALASAGFDIELRPGFGAKRDMLTARYAPRYRTRRHEPAAPRQGERQAIVIGAGLAGCCAAHALARRGWQVELLDEGPGIAGGASALPCGLLHPVPTVDDSQAARLMRAGFLFGRRLLDELDARSTLPEPLLAPGGVLQLIEAGAAGPDWPGLIEQQRWPAGYMRWCDAPQAAHRVGLRPRQGGLWFAQGAVVSAQAWCRALVSDQAGIHLQRRQRVLRIEPAPGGWRIDTDHGGTHCAPVVVVAAALDGARLLASAFAPVQPIHGLISRLAPDSCARLRAGISGNGYLLPGLDGRAAVGATYEAVPPGLAPMPEARAHQSNLQRLARLLAEPIHAVLDGRFEGIRCVSRDRMPLSGAAADETAALAQAGELRGAHLIDLPRRPGLYASFALGSRGLALAPLLGETIACLAQGEPLPIERALAASADPARFLLRRLRAS